MSDNELLAHAIKALTYRSSKVTQGSTETFEPYKISPHTRSPTEIPNHMHDLMSKTQTMIYEGHFTCPPSAVLDFEGERN